VPDEDILRRNDASPPNAPEKRAPRAELRKSVPVLEPHLDAPGGPQQGPFRPTHGQRKQSTRRPNEETGRSCNNRSKYPAPP
jgi:hypothetical protein